MGNCVKTFEEIPFLFSDNEEENDMADGRKGHTKIKKKDIPAHKDRIIQFIWDYQQKHSGDTPTNTAIAQHMGQTPGPMRLWLNRLYDDKRIDIIATNPLRITVLDHAKNTNAIERFKRLSKMREEHEEREREQIRERQAQDKAAEEAMAEQERRNAVSAELLGNTLNEAPPKADFEMPQTRPANDPVSDAVVGYTRAARASEEMEPYIKAVMHRLLPLAESRDMVAELVERGYTVTKNVR